MLIILKFWISIAFSYFAYILSSWVFWEIYLNLAESFPTLLNSFSMKHTVLIWIPIMLFLL